ncbi:MAG TPA: hypothetical protein VGG64_18385 [Pirellulales bacterium]
MPCVHLRELYSLCQQHDLKISSADLVHIVCNQCGIVETCPSVCDAEYDRKPHDTDCKVPHDGSGQNTQM